MKKIDELLSEQSFSGDVLKIFKISANWTKVMGDFIGKNSTPIKINNDQLVIAVSDNLWMNEFTMMKNEFLERLKGFGYNHIKDIRFVVKHISKKNEPFNCEPVFTDDMIKLASEVSKVIKNDELRVKYERAFLAYLAFNKEKG